MRARPPQGARQVRREVEKVHSPQRRCGTRTVLRVLGAQFWGRGHPPPSYHRPLAERGTSEAHHAQLLSLSLPEHIAVVRKQPMPLLSSPHATPRDADVAIWTQLALSPQPIPAA